MEGLAAKPPPPSLPPSAAAVQVLARSVVLMGMSTAMLAQQGSQGRRAEWPWRSNR